MKQNVHYCIQRSPSLIRRNSKQSEPGSQFPHQCRVLTSNLLHENNTKLSSIVLFSQSSDGSMANMMLLECCLRVPLAFERNRITGALQLITSTEMPMNTKSITHKLHRLNAEMYCPQTLSFLRTRTRT